MKALSNKNWFLPLVVFLVGLGTLTVYFYVPTPSGDLPMAESNQSDYWLARVGELVVLPKNEIPTIATVTDLKQLPKQEFFAQAKEGDKVLVYPEHGKAILYRPDGHQVVEIAPFAVSN